MDQKRFQKLAAQPRKITVAKSGDEDLGPLKHLPGTWEGKGKGFNMIALPYDSHDLKQYRLLLNQYDEHLTFSLVDKSVPNRGPGGADQLIVALDYEQVIHQVAAIDHPESGLAGPAGKAIHHEAGLFLYLLNEVSDGLNVARLATIPHGDTALLLGSSRDEENRYPDPFGFRGLPLGAKPGQDDDPEFFYFEPYKFLHDNPFLGFDPLNPMEKLRESAPNPPVMTTVLDFDSTNSAGAIQNAPFIVRQNNAVSMTSTFWIYESAAGLRLQYRQVVMMEFRSRLDGLPGLIQWPHVSVNTLEKVSETPQSYRKLVADH